jgi:hypothetical protein
MLADAVAVAGKGVEVGMKGRNAESSDGIIHPIRRRKNSNQGKIGRLFMIMTG